MGKLRQDLRSALSLQPVEGGGTWSYGHKKMNSAKNLNELGSELFSAKTPGNKAAADTAASRPSAEDLDK